MSCKYNQSSRISLTVKIIQFCYINFRELSAASSQCSDELSDTDRLHRRIIELSEQLEKREYKLMELAKQNAELHSKNEDLSQSLSKDGGAKVTTINSQGGVGGDFKSGSTTANVDTVTAEFTHRLSAIEKKFQHAIRERDQLRDQLKSANSRIPKEVHETAVREKEFLIKELQQEGEKLSKQVLQHSTIIKKLRAKEKETDEQLKRQKEEISVQNEEMERLKKSLAAKEDVERSQIEAVNRLASVKICLEAETSDLKGKLEDLQQKFDALQVSFAATKQELVDQRKKADELKNKSVDLESQCAVQREERLKGDALEKELQEMREKLRQLEVASQAREQSLRRENVELMRRLEEGELRAEELNEQLAGATVPLLKQMQGLQLTLDKRQAVWQKQEKELVEELARAEERLRGLVGVEERGRGIEEGLRREVENLEGKIAGLMLKVEKSAAEEQQRAIEVQLRVGDVQREKEREKERWAGEVEQKEREIEELRGEVDRLKRELKEEEGRARQKEKEPLRGFERDEFGSVEEENVGDCCRGDHHHQLSRENSLDGSGSLTSNQWPLVSKFEEIVSNWRKVLTLLFLFLG